MSLYSLFLDLKDISGDGGRIISVAGVSEEDRFVALLTASSAGCIGSTSYAEGDLIVVTNMLEDNDYLDNVELLYERCGSRNEGGISVNEGSPFCVRLYADMEDDVRVECYN